MEEMLKLKAYSRSTIKTYLNEMSQLLTVLNDIPADLLTPSHLRIYLIYCYEKLQLKEPGRLFAVLQNLKHKAMLFTVYSAGMRVSELLQIKDIDSSRMFYKKKIPWGH
jgi:integrase/recombinase XerD